MRTTFSSSIRDYMTHDYYIKQTMSMCENRLNQILAKNPKLINCLNRQSNHPLIRKTIVQNNYILSFLLLNE